MSSVRVDSFDINNNKFNCIIMGKGADVCYIHGPGSFYLKGLISAGLGEYFTFITCDRYWSQHKSEQCKDEKISLDEIMSSTHQLMQSIKKFFHCNKIGMIGISAPGCLALRYSVMYPDDVAWLQLIGVCFEKIDSGFNATNALFMKEAGTDRINAFNNAQDNFKRLLQDDRKAISPPNMNYISLNGKRRLTPNSEWLAETLALFNKAFYHNTVKHKYAYFEHWRDNPIRQIINQVFRKYFFENLLPKLNPMDDLMQIEMKGIPVQVFNLEEDYIIKLSAEIRNRLTKMKNVAVLDYKACGHCPYEEKPEEFCRDMIAFSEKLYRASSCEIRAKL